MLGIAAGLATKTGIEPVGLYETYIESWAVVTFLCLMFWALVEVARMAKARVEHPLPPLYAGMVTRLPLAGIPALLFPLFLGSYTWAKCSIPDVVGYPWEQFWADADRALLGMDAWRIAHAVMPAFTGHAWSFFYSMVWGFALVFGGSLIFAFGNRRETATFFTAMMLAWMIGGVGVAYALSAAGPTFAHLTDPSLATRFEPMRMQLLSTLGDKDVVLTTQKYLAAALNSPQAVKGAGISAMPSMHIATATILMLASWNHRLLRAGAMLFLAMTFFGSVYFGYHYALDAPVAGLIAWACWRVARRLYSDAPVMGAVQANVQARAE